MRNEQSGVKEQMVLIAPGHFIHTQNRLKYSRTDK